MARRVKGTDRVIMAPFTAQWPDGRCVLAYAKDDAMAVVAIVPVPDAPHGSPSLWEVAARHLPASTLNETEAYGRWLLGTGWSLSVMPPAGGLIVKDEGWTVEVFRSCVLKEPVYGSDGVHVGRMAFDNPAVMDKARSLLPLSASRPHSPIV
ncbi:hypothetical protein AB0K09_33430 [Streptomyces sp. NPDC049577]|uniref:hypothetical protein n=1 Tax=Streptomyces sp. NPDC049577 TaxID=3155153 RepID=UPI00342CF08C